MGKDISVAAKITVRKTVTGSGDSAESDEIIEINKFETTPAMAIVEIPIVMTHGYQSIGITIGVHLPVYAEEIEQGIEKAYQIALARATREIPDIKRALVEKMADQNQRSRKKAKKA